MATPLPTPPAYSDRRRDYSGWIALIALFGVIVPLTIASSYSDTDVRSSSPAVQSGNLEAAVQSEAPGDASRKAIEAVVQAMTPKHLTDAETAEVYACAQVELHRPLQAKDLAPLKTGTDATRRKIATLYATIDHPQTSDRAIAESLPTDRFLTRLVRAQYLERLGDHAERAKLSPDLNPSLNAPVARFQAALFSVGFLGGIVVLLSYLLQLKSGAIRWLGHPLEPESPRDSDRLAVRAAQFFALMLVAGFVVAGAAQLLPNGTSPSGAFLAEVLASIATLGLTLLLTNLPVSGVRLTLSKYGITKKAIFPSLGWGIVGVFAVVPLATVGAFIGRLFESVSPRPDHPLAHVLADASSVWVVIGALILASIQAPITEELLFRGTLMPALSGLFARSKLRAPLAILVSSLLFASLHPQGFSLWLPLASVGIVNGVLCYHTRSILPGIFMHAVFNGAIVVLSLMHP